MLVKKVTPATMRIYDNLCQAYEAEFSALTHKQPDKNGVFVKDTQLEGKVVGFLVYIQEHPAGLAAIQREQNNQFEVCEFYIVPFYRRQCVGLRFAHALFEQMPGHWQIKQIAGANSAVAFWRTVVRNYTKGKFQETSYGDKYWGRVTRQTFSNAVAL